MKLQITFPKGDSTTSVEYPWDDKKKFDENMLAATILATDEGMTLEQIRQDKVEYRAIKEREGETCPCCGRELK